MGFCSRATILISPWDFESTTLAIELLCWWTSSEPPVQSQGPKKGARNLTTCNILFRDGLDIWAPYILGPHAPSACPHHWGFGEPLSWRYWGLYYHGLHALSLKDGLTRRIKPRSITLQKGPLFSNLTAKIGLWKRGCRVTEYGWLNLPSPSLSNIHTTNTSDYRQNAFLRINARKYS